jgi:nitroreductase
MDVLSAIINRQSVKSYLDRPVEDEVLAKILEAGQHAPSAMNEQHRKFVVVRDKETKRKIREAAGAQPMVEQAGALIVLCATESEFVMPCGQYAYPIDCTLAGAYMMLEAYELGLGTCWLGAFDPKPVKEILGIPENVTVVTMIPLGYHDGTQPRRDRKELSEIVSYDHY